MAEWSVQQQQQEWVDAATWHAHTAVVVSPDGHECSLEEVVEVLNRCTMAMRNIANNAHIVVGPPAEELARLRRPVATPG